MYAAYNGSIEVTEYLLANGADVNTDVNKDKVWELIAAFLEYFSACEIVRRCRVHIKTCNACETVR